MVIILIVNVANIYLNDILINGRMGFPEMGAEGSAWATNIVRFMMMSMIVRMSGSCMTSKNMQFASAHFVTGMHRVINDVLGMLLG
jgi:Na+-driven multidrug efflux pump